MMSRHDLTPAGRAAAARQRQPDAMRASRAGDGNLSGAIRAAQAGSSCLSPGATALLLFATYFAASVPSAGAAPTPDDTTETMAITPAAMGTDLARYGLGPTAEPPELDLVSWAVAERGYPEPSRPISHFQWHTYISAAVAVGQLDIISAEHAQLKRGEDQVDPAALGCDRLRHEYIMRQFGQPPDNFELCVNELTSQLDSAFKQAENYRAKSKLRNQIVIELIEFLWRPEFEERRLSTSQLYARLAPDSLYKPHEHQVAKTILWQWVDTQILQQNAPSACLVDFLEQSFNAFNPQTALWQLLQTLSETDESKYEKLLAHFSRYENFDFYMQKVAAQQSDAAGEDHAALQSIENFMARYEKRTAMVISRVRAPNGRWVNTAGLDAEQRDLFRHVLEIIDNGEIRVPLYAPRTKPKQNPYPDVFFHFTNGRTRIQYQSAFVHTLINSERFNTLARDPDSTRELSWLVKFITDCGRYLPISPEALSRNTALLSDMLANDHNQHAELLLRNPLVFEVNTRQLVQEALARADTDALKLLEATSDQTWIRPEDFVPTIRQKHFSLLKALTESYLAQGRHLPPILFECAANNFIRCLEWCLRDLEFSPAQYVRTPYGYQTPMGIAAGRGHTQAAWLLFQAYIERNEAISYAETGAMRALWPYSFQDPAALRAQLNFWAAHITGALSTITLVIAAAIALYRNCRGQPPRIQRPPAPPPADPGRP